MSLTTITVIATTVLKNMVTVGSVNWEGGVVAWNPLVV